MFLLNEDSIIDLSKCHAIDIVKAKKDNAFFLQFHGPADFIFELPFVSRENAIAELQKVAYSLSLNMKFYQMSGEWGIAFDK